MSYSVIKMITVEEALNIIQNRTGFNQHFEAKSVQEALGYTLFENVVSPIDMPPFRQSAMDGYALNLNGNDTFNIIGVVKAGDGHQPILKKGEAVRIFTGAPVPDSANTVIMQEKISRNENTIKLDDPITINLNIRTVGEQVKKSQLALAKDTKLTPAAIGYLSSLGIKEVNVYQKPTIAIIATGNELIEPGLHLEYGQIYESNSKMLLSTLYSLKFYDVTLHKVKDDYNETLNTLDKVIKTHDLVIISGGISVGDYDFVGEALKALHVEEHFYKVNQKPGKPLFFGTKEDTYIFALPGNPAASLTCFYMYVFTALQRLMNNEFYKLPRIQVKSESLFKKHGDRPQFLKAIYNGNAVTILEGQSSSMLQTYAICNALVFMPGEQSKIKVDDLVEVILLPV